jgi:opacity protein-like surface antigen
MNIKSLLLGSAAALVAVSGAKAADVVVAPEPEPVEYVRVCDVYGAGFFYIPGTEVCLKFDGYFRYDIGAGDLFGLESYDKKDFFDDGTVNINDTYYKRMRAAFRWDARTETELGTLRGYAHINFQVDTNQDFEDPDGDGPVGLLPVVSTDDEVAINHAYIELGGFRVGKTDTLFVTYTDYASGLINDDIIPFGPYDTHQIAYTFTGGNGFSFAIALEEGDDDPYVSPFGTFVSDNAYTLDDYVPHVVAGVGYTGGWGGLRAVGAYDAVWEEWAAKVRLDLKPTEAISLFVMGGYKSAEDVEEDIDTDGDGIADTTVVTEDAGPNWYGNWSGDSWAVWGGASWVVTPKATINFGASYTEAEDFYAGINVAYELVPGFVITPEIAYLDNFADNDLDDIVDDDDAFDGDFGGFLRFQRNF